MPACEGGLQRYVTGRIWGLSQWRGRKGQPWKCSFQLSRACFLFRPWQSWSGLWSGSFGTPFGKSGTFMRRAPLASMGRARTMEPIVVSREEVGGKRFIVIRVLVRTTNRFRTEYRVSGRKVSQQVWEAERAARQRGEG
jgi:hypothetical protein